MESDETFTQYESCEIFYSEDAFALVKKVTFSSVCLIYTIKNKILSLSYFMCKKNFCRFFVIIKNIKLSISMKLFRGNNFEK